MGICYIHYTFLLCASKATKGVGDAGQSRGKEPILPNYELTYILRPLEEADLAAANERIAALVQTHGGEIVARSDWGRRRLAYPIRKYLEGYYTTLYLTLPSQAVRLIERALRLSDDVLRYLVVRVETHTLPQLAPDTGPSASAMPTTPSESQALKSNATETTPPTLQSSPVAERS